MAVDLDIKPDPTPTAALRGGVAGGVWLLIPAFTAAVLLWLTAQPFQDVDLYWHVLVGYDIADDHRFTGDPAWVFTAHAQDWRTTQWASELLMAGLHWLFGWQGLTLLGFLGTTATCLSLALTVLPVTRIGGRVRINGSGVLVSSVVVTVAYIAVGFDYAERPQMVSFAILPVVGWWASRYVQAGVWPRWWVLLALVWVWAQFHGYWVLAAVAVTTAFLARAAARRSLAGLRESFWLAAGCSLVGGVSPAGVYAYKAPLRIKDVGAAWITEWQHPEILNGCVLALLMLLALVGQSWWRTRGQAGSVLAGEVLWCLPWLALAATTYRNVTVAVLMLAPLIAERARRAYPDLRAAAHGSRITGVLIVLVLAAGFTAGVVRTFTGSPHPSWTPHTVYEALASQPGERRVLTIYNLSGQTLALTRPGVRLSIDGRADMWGLRRVNEQMNLLEARPGWEETLARLHPTDALIFDYNRLGPELERLGWRKIASEKHKVLYTAPRHD